MALETIILRTAQDFILTVRACSFKRIILANLCKNFDDTIWDSTGQRSKGGTP
jgi:hypothetical protein